MARCLPRRRLFVFLFVVVLAAVVVRVESRPRQPRSSDDDEGDDSCILRMTPSSGVISVNPRSDVSFVCDASCLGPLRRGQLVWKDKNERTVPSMGSSRIHAVSYRRWMINRLVIRSAMPEDSGVYVCEVQRRGGGPMSYPVTLDVPEEPSHSRRDDGPRRGDVRPEPDPEFGEIRPVRDASERRYRSRQQRLGRKLMGVEEQPQALKRRRVRRQAPDNSTTPPTNSSSSSITNDTTSADDNTTTTPNPMGDSTSPGETTPIPDVMAMDSSVTQMMSDDDDTTTDGGPAGMDYGVMPNASDASPPMDGHGNGTVDPSSVGNATTSGSSDLENTTGIPPAPQTTPAGSPTGDPGSSPSSSTSPSPTTPTSAAGGGGAGTTGGASMPKSPKTTPSTTTKAAEGGAGEGGVGNQASASKSQGDGDGETDFGRYGLLAFGLALTVIILLLIVLLLFFILPRYCAHSAVWNVFRANDKHEEGQGVPKHTGSQPGDNNVILLGERSHKPVSNMQSATGLNGEFITPVDLDAKEDGDTGGAAGGGDGGKDGDGAKKAEGGGGGEGGRKKSENFVSTFVIGRLSSSAEAPSSPTSGGAVLAGNTAAVDDNVFSPAASTPVIEEKTKKERRSTESSSSSSDDDDDDDDEGPKKPGGRSSKDNSKDNSKDMSLPYIDAPSAAPGESIQLVINPQEGVVMDKSSPTDV